MEEVNIIEYKQGNIFLEKNIRNSDQFINLYFAHKDQQNEFLGLQIKSFNRLTFSSNEFNYLQDLRNSAIHFQAAGQYKKSIDVWNFLLKQYPEDETINYYLGLCYEGLKNYQEAVRLYQEKDK